MLRPMLILGCSVSIPQQCLCPSSFHAGKSKAMPLLHPSALELPPTIYLFKMEFGHFQSQWHCARLVPRISLTTISGI